MKQKFFRIILISLLVLTGGYCLIFSNRFLHILFPEKIWPHRINTIPGLLESRERFSGIELDIVYEKDLGDFYVYHPPQPSSHLTLKAYFESLGEKANYNYWLDFRNLSPEISEIAAQTLDSLIRSLNIDKINLIVESPSPQCLNHFNKRGYPTSYYLPSDLYLLEKSALVKKLEELKQQNSLFPTQFLSFDCRDYPIIHNNFPDHQKLTWFTGYGKQSKISVRYNIVRALCDPQTKILLLPFH